VKWNLNEVLICISLITKYWNCFTYLWGICTSSFAKCLFFHSIAHLLIELFVLLLFSFFSSLNILNINLLSEKYLPKIFSPSVGFPFTLLIVSWNMQTLFNLMLFYLLILTLISWAIAITLRKSLHLPRSWIVSSMFSSSFRSYIKLFDPFWLDYYTVWEIGICFSLLHVDIQFCQNHLLKRLSFLQCMHFCWESSSYSCTGLFLDPLLNSIGSSVCLIANIMLLLLLWICSIIWNQVSWYHHYCSFA
jgi:hypothetical protein